MQPITSISPESLQDLIYIHNGVFAPLDRFMSEDDYKNVVHDMRLSTGEPWTIPITLDVERNVYTQAIECGSLLLSYDGKVIAKITNCNGFKVTDEDIGIVFKTMDETHPGVAKEKAKSVYRIGGKVEVLDQSILTGALSPDKTKKAFTEKGFDTIAGFQTRNPVHKAHEYLLRTALEVCDGIFINPIIGWKKQGDFTEKAVISAYTKMISNFFPKENVYFEGLKTQMRYAGPREAVFHAIIRRNLGCTHFIIGRDHAGVGGFYQPYEAHDLAKAITKQYDLGINLLLFREPYYCTACEQIVTDKTCSHSTTHKMEVSGTLIRKNLSEGNIPDERFMRKEISQAIIDLKSDMFIN